MSQVGITELTKVKSKPVNIEAGCNKVTQVRDSMVYAQNSKNPVLTEWKCLTKEKRD